MRLIGNKPAMKIVEFFVRTAPCNYNKTQISEALSMGKGTLHKSWKILEEFDIVRTISSDGKSRFYVLNKENKIVTTLLKLISVIEDV
jgi:DNA-binding IclR family transcriptional regulator